MSSSENRTPESTRRRRIGSTRPVHAVSLLLHTCHASRSSPLPGMYVSFSLPSRPQPETRNRYGQGHFEMTPA